MGGADVIESLPPERPFWIVDGQAYDFSDWMHRHPGGAIWFKVTRGRDISIIFHVFHRRPEKLKSILNKYLIKPVSGEPFKVSLEIPLIADLDTNRELPSFDFKDENQLLFKIRRRLEEAIPSRVLRRWDQLFDVVSLLLLTLHLSVFGLLLFSKLPAWLAVFSWVITRTALSGCGHYYLHRKKPNWGDGLFDMNYVGTCLFTFDSHTMIHHSHLLTKGDIKQVLFDNFQREIHPILRIVAYPLYKLGECLVGLCIFATTIVSFQSWDDARPEFWLTRVWMILEFIICALSGHILFWLLQYFVTLWYNTFLVFASHDFGSDEDDPSFGALPVALQADWSAQQIHRSYDLSITGNRYLDLYLSAGLSPHRVHHVLPAQRSGFANIASEEVVKKVWEGAGLRWARPRHFLLERLPIVFELLVMRPVHSRGRRPEPTFVRCFDELRVFLRYILSSWKGEVFN